MTSAGRRVAPAARPFIVMNPHSGGGKVQQFDLLAAAQRLGARVRVLDVADADVSAWLNEAVDVGADLLGVAGGDGTIGAVAATAADRDVPLLVIPAGTRNHFALDLGLDPSRPGDALDALIDGVEIRVDLGVAGARSFVNTVSFGAYAEVVERPDYRENKLLVTLSALPEVLADRTDAHFTVRAGSVTVTDPLVALISNNPYRVRKVPGAGHRPRLDGGRFGLLCVERAPRGGLAAALREHGLHAPATVTTADEIVVDAVQPPIPVAVDGEATSADTPLHCRMRPRALRVRLPARVP